MKNILILFLMVMSFVGYSQTDDYNAVSTNTTWVYADDSKTLVYPVVADTLVSSDTLIITIPVPLGSRCKITFAGDVTDYSTDDATKTVSVNVLGAACADCDYYSMYSLWSYEIGEDEAYVNTPIEVFEMIYLKVQIATSAAQVILDGHLIIKPE